MSHSDAEMKGIGAPPPKDSPCISVDGPTFASSNGWSLPSPIQHQLASPELLKSNAIPNNLPDLDIQTRLVPCISRSPFPHRFFGFGRRSTHPKEEPFVPVDPFRLLMRWLRRGNLSRLPEPVLQGTDDVRDDSSSPHGMAERRRWKAFATSTDTVIMDVLPCQVYLCLLLWIPAVYLSRVARVFEDAEVSKPDIQRMINACTPDESSGATPTDGGSLLRPICRPSLPLPATEDWNPPMVSPALVRFKHSWEIFIDSLLREWKTLNLVSALFCTAILTMFQIEAAANDSFARSAALFSLVFALMSLCYGCVYIVRFGAMRSMGRASRWAEEAQKSETAVFRNIWILLATPAIWLAWSMISFRISILAFVWRTGSIADENPPPPLTRRAMVRTIY
ncbi:hypothetical protein BKA93DRAFT_829381 [Sparassis latifolia]